MADSPMADSPMSRDEQARLAQRDAWRESEQERQQRVRVETDKRQHVTVQEDSRLRDMVRELLDYEPDDDGGERLTEWELAFLDDVGGFELLYSPKQAEKIEQIWNRIFK